MRRKREQNEKEWNKSEGGKWEERVETNNDSTKGK